MGLCWQSLPRVRLPLEAQGDDLPHPNTACPLKPGPLSFTLCHPLIPVPAHMTAHRYVKTAPPMVCVLGMINLVELASPPVRPRVGWGRESGEVAGERRGEGPVSS